MLRQEVSDNMRKECHNNVCIEGDRLKTKKISAVRRSASKGRERRDERFLGSYAQK
jgi:hypothetical protein